MKRITSALLPFESIPGPKPSLPFIGTNWIYFPWVGYYRSTKLHEANLDKYYRYGPIMKEEYQRGYPSVTIFDPSDIKKVFMREGTCPSRPVLPYVIKHRQSDPSRYPNVGLANMMGEEWANLRSQLAPLMLSDKLKNRHIGSQNRVSTRLVNYIKNSLPALHEANVNNCSQSDGNFPPYHHPNNFEPQQQHQLSGIVPNIQEVFYRFSMESIMNLCINQELGCLNSNSSITAASTMTSGQANDSINSTSARFDAANLADGELIFQAAMDFFEAQHKLYYGLGFWKYFNTKPYRQLRDSQNVIHDIASKYIDVALNRLKQKRVDSKSYHSSCPFAQVSGGDSNGGTSVNGDEHESLLETLFMTNKFDDLEIKSTIVDFIGGGIYTVANTLTMALFLLASNPQVQEQLHQEICKVFGRDINDINVDREKLDQLKFLKLCLKESYRLLPTIPGIARTLHQDMVLANHLVPKNTLVFCNFMVACRLPQYFENPNSYNPSRWERTGEVKGDSAICLQPFGHGVRKCIGHNFAELEIYVALAKLIRCFKVTTLDGQDAESLDLSYKFIVVPEKPVTLKFTPREVGDN